ncbi:RnfABCDGE type electron transport complex subunit D [Enterococcus silesiacus]|uniref:RnfABCDGE type electron transport complex subunit D n=1 Tax=Enterococcus silesiacus TaxID=332949 RepID=UPI001C26E01D|nr:RnfABCDGE type electron transport complex subunit D [Enterococcus silesiacus]
MQKNDVCRLLLRKISNSFYIAMLLYSAFDFSFTNVHLLSDTLIFTAVFMVTDYTTLSTFNSN